MESDKAFYDRSYINFAAPIVVLAAFRQSQYAYAQMGAYSDEIQMFCQTVENTAVRMIENLSGLED